MQEDFRTNVTKFRLKGSAISSNRNYEKRTQPIEIPNFENMVNISPNFKCNTNQNNLI